MRRLDSHDPVRSGQMTIRLHDGEPDPSLRRLAHLDASSVPTGPLLVAETGGEALAAVSLADGTAIANPFRPTGAAVELLRLRAQQLDETPQRPSRWRRMLPGAGRRRQASLAGSPPGAGGRLLQL